MGFFFSVFYQPVANLLLYPLVVLETGSVVFGIVCAVFLIKLVLLNISIKNTRMQIRLQSITEDLKSVRENIKDRREQAEETMKIYKEAGINPFSPLLLLLIQIPVFLSMFFVVNDIGKGTFAYQDTLYSFVGRLPEIDLNFLIFNLSESGNLSIALLVGLTQAFLMHHIQRHITDPSKQTQKIFFSVIFPIIAAVASFFFSTIVGMYWLINNLFSILQEIIVTDRIRKEESEELEAEHP